jgi:ribokinase
MNIMRPPEVLVIGDANPDLLITGDRENIVPEFGQVEKLVDSADLVMGGSASIAACGLARLGVPTALAAVVGADVFGDFVRSQLAAAGVDTRWLRTDPDVPTALSVVLSAGDRAILTLPGTLATTGVDVVDTDLLGRVRHVHSASMFLLGKLAPHLPGIFAAARSGGASTSLDTNWDPAGLWQGVLPLVAHTDVVFPNAPELLAMTQAADVDSAAARIVGLGCRVALKDGARGGVLWEGPTVTRVAAPVTEVVDTTGAGDSFDAGFISGMVEQLSGAACLERAVRCGSLSTRAVGGTAAQASRADLL